VLRAQPGLPQRGSRPLARVGRWLGLLGEVHNFLELEEQFEVGRRPVAELTFGAEEGGFRPVYVRREGLGHVQVVKHLPRGGTCSLGEARARHVVQAELVPHPGCGEAEGQAHQQHEATAVQGHLQDALGEHVRAEVCTSVKRGLQIDLLSSKKDRPSEQQKRAIAAGIPEQALQRRRGAVPPESRRLLRRRPGCAAGAHFRAPALAGGHGAGRSSIGCLACESPELVTGPSLPHLEAAPQLCGTKLFDQPISSHRAGHTDRRTSRGMRHAPRRGNARPQRLCPHLLYDGMIEDCAQLFLQTNKSCCCRPTCGPGCS
jgi:hypothetical protein